MSKTDRQIVDELAAWLKRDQEWTPPTAGASDDDENADLFDVLVELLKGRQRLTDLEVGGTYVVATTEISGAPFGEGAVVILDHFDRDGDAWFESVTGAPDGTWCMGREEVCAYNRVES